MKIDRAALREAQEPLKRRYGEDPHAALVTLRARGALGEGVSCSVETGRALAEADTHAKILIDPASVAQAPAKA